MWVAVLMALSLLWHLRNQARDREVLDAPLTAWICVAIAQGGVGYLQYANGVPPVLVGVHVALATTLWACSIWLWCATSRLGSSVATSAKAADELRELVDGRSEERAD